MISHDLRSPINVAQGCAALLAEQGTLSVSSNSESLRLTAIQHSHIKRFVKQ
ncbi:hypothetical protein [Halorubrum halophilum]|uniref:hypothetical protein n=1 Tax=Halorubrum halophilum TaxID=413816 RepID=UPI001D00F818